MAVDYKMVSTDLILIWDPMDGILLTIFCDGICVRVGD